MKYVINLVVVVVIAILAYVLVDSIKEPIEFRAEKDKRKNVIVERLQNIRTSQELYREIKGEYSGSFDDLKNVLLNDSLPFIQLLADPNDPENPDKFTTNIIYYSAKDSVESLGIDLDNMKFVPYAPEGTEFTMQADTTTYQKTLVPVMECMTRWSEFMGVFADSRYKKYDDTYDPNRKIGFGSMSSPNLEGNWN